MEFRYREADFGQFPKGLMYGLDIMGSWLYDDENAFSQVQLLSIYDRLKKAVNEGYFEKLIQKWLLDSTHGLILTLVPKRGLAAQRERIWRTSWKLTEAVFLMHSWRNGKRRPKLLKLTRNQRRDRRIFSVFRC